MYIGGEWVAPSSGEWFESYNPFTGEPWALIPRGNAADADHAVRTAHAAFTDGPWPQMTATQRGALLRKLGDLVAQNAQQLAEIEVRDNGKLIAEMAAPAQLRAAVVLLLRRPGGQGAGRGHSARQERLLQLHALRAARRGGRDHAVEFAADADRLEARARAGGRQHGGDQAVGVHLGLGAGVRQAGGGGGLSRRAWSTSSPATARRSACRWSSIR